MQRPTERMVFFAAAVAAHLLLLLWLNHTRFGVDTNPPAKEDVTQFQMVKVAPTPPPPPPPPPSGGTSKLTPPALPTSTSIPVPNIPNTITSANNFEFTAPKVQISGDIDSKMASPTINFGTNGSNGFGQLYGLSIQKNEKMIVVLDESGSMTNYIPILQKQIADSFPDSLLIPSASALGKFDTPQTSDKFCDLYEAAKRGLDQNAGMTAVFIMTDFEDGDVPEDTKAFVDMLQQRGIRLYIRSVGRPAYSGLEDYVNQSGGSYDCEKPDMTANH